MKSIIFDAGPIISLTTNNLLWILKELKERYNGQFYIAEAVKQELVDKPLSTKKFKFEALQVLHCINEGIINVIDAEQIEQKTIELLTLANSCFNAKNNLIRIVHYGEIAGIASYLLFNSDAFVIDERTTRLLIENPKRLGEILKHKLCTKIVVNNQNLEEFRKLTKGVKMIRSVELVTVAYELGLLNKFLASIEHPKETLLDSVLWGVKLRGCSVSKNEIKQITRLEQK